jgi:REP element-mobilizing transposase RayT
MSTKPRIVAPDLIYEITSKGARGVKVLSSAELKSFFLKELIHTLQKFSYHCYAWSIMDDHYHLVLKSSDVPISIFLQRLNSVYAKHFNKVRGESGVVFYKRFASIIVHEDGLKELVRYVHLNPVRCGTCTLELLYKYEWCGHRFLLSNDSDHFQNTKDVLKMFSGSDLSKAYRDYVHVGQSEHENTALVKSVRDANHGMENFFKSEAWVLGNRKFVKETLEKDRCRRARIAQYVQDNVTFEVIHEKVETTLNLSKGDLFYQGRLDVKATARLLFVYIGKLRYNFSGTSLANYLGVSSSAVTKMISRCKTVLNIEFLIMMISKNVQMA